MLKCHLVFPFSVLLCRISVAVLHPHDVPTGVILQFLCRPAAGLDVCAVAAQVIAELRSALESIQLLEQTTFFIIGVGLKYMAVGTHHCEHTPLGVIGVLVARTVVGLGAYWLGRTTLERLPLLA